MPAVPPPIDWEAPYGRDWHAVRATLIYGPTATRALFEWSASYFRTRT
jgi:hypothetical protein